MLLEAGRDTAAMFALDQLLSSAREDYLEQVLSGQVPGEDFWTVREAAATDEIKRRFYNRKVREAVRPGETEKTQAEGESSKSEIDPPEQTIPKADQADFDQHGQKLTEQAIWMTHEILKQIPCVGSDNIR